MDRKKLFFFAVASIFFIIGTSVISYAQETGVNITNSILDVQKYERAIHIMAMLMVGFGFLMVFVKKYGRSALTATFLLVSIAIPIYFFVDDLSFFGNKKEEIEKIILAEFGAASLLIAAGALLGRLTMYPYIILGFLFIPF